MITWVAFCKVVFTDSLSGLSFLNDEDVISVLYRHLLKSPAPAGPCIPCGPAGPGFPSETLVF